MTAPAVSLDIVGQAKSAKAEITETIRHLTLLGNATEVTSKQEVAAYQRAAEAAKGHAAALGASEDQMLRLRAATMRMEERVQSSGERFAVAGERGERALSMIERSGALTGRSINSLLASVGQLGFDLGPEGAVIAGIAMVAAGIIDHFDNVQEKLTELTEKFNHSITEILLNDSAIEAARAGGRAMIAELEAVAKRRDDIVARKSSVSADWRIISGGDDDNIMANATNVDGARHAERTLQTVHASDKDIENAKAEEKRAHESLVSWQDKAAALRSDGKTVEARVAQARVTELTETETALRNQVRALEAGRDATARLLAGTEKDPATKYALTHPDKARDHTSFDEEDRQSGVESGDRRTQDQLARLAKSDAAKEALRKKAEADERRSAAMLTQLRDETTQQQLLAEGKTEQAEEAVAQREYDRNVSEIEQLSVKETRKTELLVAAAADRDQRIRAIQKKAADTQLQEYLREWDKELNEFDRYHDRQVRAEEAKERRIHEVLEHSVDTLVRGHESLGQRILKAALEPEVKHLEALAAKHMALAAADAATGNFTGAAEQFAGAAALIAGASLVASFGGGGGGGGAGGGGGDGGGGGSGGMSSASRLGASGGQSSGPLMMQLVVVHQDATGREISRTAQSLQRLDDRNVPIRIGGLG